MLTIDASVWISAVSSTELAYGQSRRFLDLALSTQAVIIVPTLLTVEIVATIARRNNQDKRAAEIAGLFQMMSTVEWISLDKQFSKIAADVALRSQLRTGDAVLCGCGLGKRLYLGFLGQGSRKAVGWNSERPESRTGLDSIASC